MAISQNFQEQLTRLQAYVAQLEGTATTQDTDDTTALSAALDAAGAPPPVTSGVAVDPAPVA
jgi:hypothetical protein